MVYLYAIAYTHDLPHVPPLILVCSNDGATYIIIKLIAKDTLNIEHLMQTFENLLLQKKLINFLDIAHI